MMSGMPPKPTAMFRAIFGRLLSSAALGGIVLFVAGAAAGTWWTLDRINEAVRGTVRTGLTTVLANAREATHHWVTRQQVLVAGLASDRSLGEAVAALVSAADRGRSTELATRELERVLDPGIRANSLRGFWIFDVDGRSLGRWPATLPSRLPPSMQEPFERALDGLPTVSTFLLASGQTGPVAALAPIRDRQGVTVAVLGLALPAQAELEQIADQSHHRSLGQVYFFDRTGRILGSSVSLPPWGQESRLVEPGTQQLTRMARAAVDRGADLDLDGYRDFQGRAVVGAWEWDAQLGLGLAVEAEVAQAYHVAETARRALLVALGLTLLLFLAVLASVMLARRRAVALTAL